MERVILNTISELECTNQELHHWIDEQYQLTLMLAHSQHPHFNTIKKLPRIDRLNRIGRHIIPDITQMQAHLTNIKKTELIAFL